MQILDQSVHADGHIDVHVMAKTLTASCWQCQTPCHRVHDTRARVKRDGVLGRYQVRLILYKRRFCCSLCRHTFTEDDACCGRYKRTTKRFREDLGHQALYQPIQQVASAAGVGPRFVQENMERVVKAQMQGQGRDCSETASLPTPRYLGIDEFARCKGHRYDTILCHLENRKVLDISEGRTSEEVQALLRRLSHPEMVQAVSMDMSASFRPAVQQALPQAAIVVDHFHVIQHVMKAFHTVVQSWAKSKEGTILLHRKQHLFLRAKEDLSAEHAQQRAHIGARLPQLEAAWLLKEQLREWYATASAETAEQALDDWMQKVKSSGCEALRKALSIFVNWRKEIVAFFTFRISNGFVEGKNNRTKMLMRQGYGYRNRQHLRLRILAGDLT